MTMKEKDEPIIFNFAIVIILLFVFQGCRQLKTHYAGYDFIDIKTDTIFINLSDFKLPKNEAHFYVNNITKLEDSYYFNIAIYNKDLSNLFTIKTDMFGSIISVIEVPELADDVYAPSSYIDLFVNNGLICMRMNYHSSAYDPTFFLDTNKQRWIENKERLDHVLFENEQYKVLYYKCDCLCCYCSEYIWFVNKISGEEHYTVAREIINYANNKFYLTSVRGKYEIEELESLDQLILCDESTSYYYNGNKKKIIENQNEEMQMHYKGEQMTNTIFVDDTNNPDFAFYDMYLNHGRKKGFHLYTSFVTNEHLLHICSIDDKCFIGEVINGRMLKIRDLDKAINLPNTKFVMQRIGQNTPQFLFVKSEIKNMECIMEINNGIIYYHYIKPFIKNIY